MELDLNAAVWLGTVLFLGGVLHIIESEVIKSTAEGVLERRGAESSPAPSLGTHKHFHLKL